METVWKNGSIPAEYETGRKIESFMRILLSFFLYMVFLFLRSFFFFWRKSNLINRNYYREGRKEEDKINRNARIRDESGSRFEGGKIRRNGRHEFRNSGR